MENHPPFTTSATTYHPSPPPTPTPITISDPNYPYPTTFIQADTTSFKNIVQLLTGSSEPPTTTTATRPESVPKNPIPPMKSGVNKKPSKLYERRNNQKNFKLSPLVPGFTNAGGFTVSPRNPNTAEILSPSILDFKSLVLSPVTPLVSDVFSKSPVNVDGGRNLDVEAEEKAIKEKGFYLHPSPASTPGRESELRLLNLFPVTSIRFFGCSSS
ncbi:hypothetical protein L6452_35487 [Arctium lappa]|uniref:Uncharacterized protein n=1 Tax=Arctium lappa TaxID=4217 RepID=A0ACB8Y7R3_ARCLA|nr:hypothetical protein L6452_35487 [Arctium lappa]